MSQNKQAADAEAITNDILEFKNAIEAKFTQSAEHTPYDPVHFVSVGIVAALSFGLSIAGHVGSNCLNYSSEILVITSSVYGLLWLTILIATYLYMKQIKFCTKRQKDNRAFLTISAFASLGCSLLMYDEYTALGGFVLVLLAVIQSFTTMLLFTVVFMHGHSPKCLVHIDEQDKPIPKETQGSSPSCMSEGYILGKVVGGLLLAFLIEHLVWISLAVAFDYTLNETDDRGTECAAR